MQQMTPSPQSMVSSLNYDALVPGQVDNEAQMESLGSH
jgi:hypothetical protein